MNNSLTRKHNPQQRIAQLARLGEVVFHIDDLANLWAINNQNTLHTTLKRYVQKGLLYRIWRGFYSLKPLSELDPWLLGIKALHQYAYLSTETILVKTGIIQQDIQYITLISSQAKKFKINNHYYYCRRLTDKFLYHPAGIYEKNKILIATPERAVADLLYFNPKYYFDGAHLINWTKVKNLQKKIGYPPVKYKK